jgi:hypothetical protein
MPKSIAPAVIPAAVVCPQCECAGRVVERMGGHYNVLGSCGHVVGIDRAKVTERARSCSAGASRASAIAESMPTFPQCSSWSAVTSLCTTRHPLASAGRTDREGRTHEHPQHGRPHH